MAKDKDKVEEAEGVDDAEAGVEVALPKGGATKEQDEALLTYKATGWNSKGYVDPSRDQEPDIAPEFGVHPHPDLSNPAPPEGAVGSEASDSPVVASFEEKKENAAAEEERVQAVADAENAAAKAAADAENKDADEDVEPVELSAGDALNLHLTPDESPKTSGAAGKK